MSAYKIGMVIGRFQVFHNGHKRMIDKALSMCDRVLVYIGSAQESRTNKNPFTYTERQNLLTEVYFNDIIANKLIILPLEDSGLGNVKEWGDMIMSITPPYLQPQLFISGKENRRNNWFENHDIDELFIAKSDNICASDLRQAIIDDNTEVWERSIPSVLHKQIPEMRKIILESCDNKETQSI